MLYTRIRLVSPHVKARPLGYRSLNKSTLWYRGQQRSMSLIHPQGGKEQPSFIAAVGAPDQNQFPRGLCAYSTRERTRSALEPFLHAHIDRPSLPGHNNIEVNLQYILDLKSLIHKLTVTKFQDPLFTFQNANDDFQLLFFSPTQQRKTLCNETLRLFAIERP